jgi:dTMP kinase
MSLRPFSDHQRGLFISVDGPSGAGKSTIVQHLAQLLVAAGEEVHVTAEPSSGPIGALCRELTETTAGHALACLYAADRYHHLEAEVRPNIEAGRVVLSDRYLPSALVMQRFDRIDPVFLWRLNAEADRPDLAVILGADPEVVSERLQERGPHNRFQLSPGSSHAEVHFYRQATERLIQAGFDVLRVDVNRQPPEQSAALIRDRLLTFFRPGGGVSGHGRDDDLTDVEREIDALHRLAAVQGADLTQGFAHLLAPDLAQLSEAKNGEERRRTAKIRRTPDPTGTLGGHRVSGRDAGSRQRGSNVTVWCPRGDLNPHALLRALAPQASASTNSATRTSAREL